MLFLGSRLNDSTLIKFEEIKHESKSSAKKPRVDSIMAANLDELDLLLLSADQHDDHKPEIGGSKIWPQFKFSVCDSLINIGPIADLAIGQPASAYFADEDDAEIADDPAQQQQQTRTGKAPSEKAKKKNFEVVTCSGHGRNSALCVLQVRGKKPKLLTFIYLFVIYLESRPTRGADRQLDPAVKRYLGRVLPESQPSARR